MFSLSQSGCEVNEDGLVMIDSGASVNVCPKLSGSRVFRNQTDQFNSEVWTEETLQEYQKSQIWLKIGNNLKTDTTSMWWR